MAGCERVFEWLNKQTAYKELTFNHAFANLNNPALTNFVADVQNENIAKVVWTDEMIKQNDYYAAKNIIDGLSPENIMEQNYQSFTKNFIKWSDIANYKYTATELNEITTVANQCANLGGTTVLKAQLFSKHILNAATNWNTNCPIPASAQRKSKAIAQENKYEMPDDFYFSLICNPCQEIVNFKIANSLLVSSLVLSDILGNEVSNIKVSEGINSIPANTLKNGVYTLALKLNSGKTISKKLVIAH